MGGVTENISPAAAFSETIYYVRSRTKTYDRM